MLLLLQKVIKYFVKINNILYLLATNLVIFYGIFWRAGIIQLYNLFKVSPLYQISDLEIATERNENAILAFVCVIIKKCFMGGDMQITFHITPFSLSIYIYKIYLKYI